MSYSCPVAMNERIKSLRNISLQAEKSNVLTLRPTILIKFPWLGMACKKAKVSKQFPPQVTCM